MERIRTCGIALIFPWKLCGARIVTVYVVFSPLNSHPTTIHLKTYLLWMRCACKKRKTPFLLFADVIRIINVLNGTFNSSEKKIQKKINKDLKLLLAPFSISSRYIYVWEITWRLELKSKNIGKDHSSNRIHLGYLLGWQVKEWILQQSHRNIMEKKNKWYELQLQLSALPTTITMNFTFLTWEIEISPTENVSYIFLCEMKGRKKQETGIHSSMVWPCRVQFGYHQCKRDCAKRCSVMFDEQHCRKRVFDILLFFFSLPLHLCGMRDNKPCALLIVE